MARSRPENAMLALALLGMLAAAYGLYLHLAGDGSSICDIGETFNCDKVNKSPWAKMLGIPVALLGMLAYAAFALLVLKRKAIERMLDFTSRDFFGYLLLFVAVMLAFQGYLTFIEIVRIHAYCLVCLVSQAVIIALTVLVAMSWRKA